MVSLENYFHIYWFIIISKSLQLCKSKMWVKKVKMSAIVQIFGHTKMLYEDVLFFLTTTLVFSSIKMDQ